ncbi:MAG: YraN family protein [Eggerthellaceae bacterium]|nr:YraN family protein [Eggerthellaceae bacterium]
MLSEKVLSEKAPSGVVAVAAGKKSPAKRRAPGKKPEPDRHNQEVGARGEKAAASFLERRGFDIRERNWKCAAGEVDIIAEEDDALVFIEVKTRTSCEHGFPEEAVDAEKRRRYEKIAGFYLKDHDFVDKSVRFDVVSLLVVAPERAFLRHHRNAFAVCE